MRSERCKTGFTHRPRRVCRAVSSLMQKMAESGGALLLMVGILLSSTQFVSSDPPRLSVSYPQGNYGLVRLSCTDDFGDPQPQPASFRVNDSLIDPDTTLVTVTESGSYYIVFTFTQSQEGVFSCETSAAGSSAQVGLAGSWLANPLAG